MTRVGTGPMPGELGAEETEKKGWAEFGTVTGRPRRAAEFDFNLARRAVMLNSATQIAITKLFDHVNNSCQNHHIKFFHKEEIGSIIIVIQYGRRSYRP